MHSKKYCMSKRHKNHSLVKFRFFSFLLLAVFIVSTAACQKSEKSESPQLNEKILRIENSLSPRLFIIGETEKANILSRMEHYKVPGVSVAVINNFKIEWAKGYGTKDVETTAPVDTETLFQAASISKPVAASAALHYVDEGLLDLDEDVNVKLVSWKVPENDFTVEKKVTLKGLLSHSAGLTVHGFPGYAQGREIPTLTQILNGEKPANTAPIRVDIIPGSYRYSGGGYTVMQLLLIDVFKKPFPVQLKETVLDPVGMKRSTYEQPLPELLQDNAAVGHRRNNKPIKGKWHTYPEMAAAGLWTTPSDLCKFAIELMQSRAGRSNKLLSQAMTHEMLTAVGSGGTYGLGLSLIGADDEFSFGHGGSNEGYRCYLVAYPEKGQGAAIMTNSDTGGQVIEEIRCALAAEYGWKNLLPVEKNMLSLDEEALKKYAGKYMFASGTISEREITITVAIKDNHLIIKGPLPELPLDIYPESETKFFATVMGMTMTFSFDEGGSVTAMTVHVGGQSVPAQKIE